MMYIMYEKLPILWRFASNYWLWAVRACVAWIFLGALQPIQPRAPLEAQQTVETVKSHVCVHTRLMDEVPEWKIQRSLQLVREMGADTIVEFMPWAYIEPHEQQFDWSLPDRIVRHAQNQGIQIIVRLGYVPYWARPDKPDDYSTLNYLPDDSLNDFRDFVARFAERYAGKIDHIIIWNEPNLAFEWGYRDIDPHLYLRMLQAVYAKAHEANPNLMILAAPLAPTLEPPGSPYGLNDLIYLEELYKAGAADYFDALAIHTYGFTQPPEEDPAPAKLNFRRAELLYDIMLHYDDSDKPVFITETGWNDNPRWTKAVRPSERVIYTINSLDWVEKNWPWLDKMCIWAFRFPWDANNYPDNFALVGSDFQIKPIYYAIQAYARGWERNDTLWLPAPAE